MKTQEQIKKRIEALQSQIDSCVHTEVPHYKFELEVAISELKWVLE